MIRLALLIALAAVTPLAAQIPNLWEGEAMVGLSGQNDTQKAERVQLSPVGLNVGFIVQPIFSKRNLSLSNQLSFFPLIWTEKPVPFDTRPVPSSNPLIINTSWVRLGTSEPEAEGHFVFFGGTGVSLTLSTPREGRRIQPVFGIGMRRWWARQLGLEMSFQCTVQELGRTACQLPVTSVWPFGGTGSPTGGS
jgi:hypothetical protein